MRELKLVLAALLVLGAAPSRTKTYVSGQVINPSHVTENEDNIYVYLQSGVDTIASNAIETADLKDSAITTGKLGTGAVTSTVILDGTIVNVDVAASAAIAFSKMEALTDDSAVVGNSSNSPAATAITNCTDTGGNHLNYTTATNSFSCGTSSVTTTNLVAFTRTAVAGSGAQAVTGMGFQPTGLLIACNDAASGARGSFGFGDDDADEYSWFMAGGSWDFDSAEIITLHSTGDMDAVLTSLDSNGFTVTWTISGAGLDAECGAMGIR